ncbi:MAG: HEAT repeat domain-containing protein [Planctomycetota bacterium]|jgi:hypothetical protein
MDFRFLCAWIGMALLPISICRAGDDISKTLEREIPRLGSEDWQEREAAHQAILQLGIQAEKQVRSAMKTASDPEIQYRLAAILQCYRLEAEEQYALKQIEKGEAFPRGESIQFRVGRQTVAEAIASIIRHTRIMIQVYPQDAALSTRLKETLVPSEHYCGGKNPALHALVRVLYDCDATFVVDAGKIVIVRLTPAVLFAGLERDLHGRPETLLEQQVWAFKNPERRRLYTVLYFLLQKVQEGGFPRDKWFTLLANRVESPSESLENRLLALRALQYFLGYPNRDQGDVEEVFLRRALDENAPKVMRHRAYQGLTVGFSMKCQDAFLSILEKGRTSVRLAMLKAIEATYFYPRTTLKRIRKDAVRKDRLEKIFWKLCASDEPDLSAYATAILALFEDEKAFQRLGVIPVPQNHDALRAFLTALSQRRMKGRLKAQDKHLDRLQALAHHDSPDIRAMIAVRMGSYVGGYGRTPDVESCLSLLIDPAPVVRYFAAESLGKIYSSMASRRFTEGLEKSRSALQKVFNKEDDKRVRDKILETLESKMK